MLDIQAVVRGVGSADEDYLESLQERLEGLGAEGLAIIFFPLDDELGIKFQMKEETLGGLLEPATSRTAA